MPDPLADLTHLEGVSSAVAAARDAVDAVLRDRGLRQVTAHQSAAALLHGARASARLTDDPDRWLSGAIRLSTELVGLSTLIRTSPGQVLARAHSLVAHGSVADETLGRLRPGAHVSARMLGLTDLLTRPTTASAVIVASVAHAELATLAPFGTADCVVARAVEHMVLIGSGVDPQAVIVVEAGHLGLREAYHGVLTGYAQGTVVGVRNWLLHCTAALVRGAQASPLAQRPS